jgi:hypothetical protein
METIISKTGNTNLCSQYTISLIKFLSANSEIYKFKSSIHGINTGHKLKLHEPSMYENVLKRSP